MLETPFTDLTGCKVPVQSVPVPGIATVEFVAAICNAGGLGMLPGSLASPDAISGMLQKLKSLTPAPAGVNFLIPFLEPGYETVTAAASNAAVVDFFYGDPDSELVQLVQQAGAVCGWQVGSTVEAQQAEQAGCDFIVQQGVEAGGHVRGKEDLLPTLQDTLDAVAIPVVAAGGIATGEDMGKVLALGAAGVRIGTRFVCSKESNAHTKYKDALLQAKAKDTTYTETFSVMWPNAPHRVLQSSIDAVNECEDEIIGEWKIGGESTPVPRASVISPTSETTGNIEAMALYAGHSVERIDSVDDIATIMDELVSGAEKVIDS